MALTLNIATLNSHKKHSTIEAARAVAKATGGLLSKLKNFAGWAFAGIVKYFNLSLSSLWDMFVQAYFAIKTFDFGATDETLEKQIQANNKRLVVLAAEALGETLGFQTVRMVNAFLGRFGGDKSRATVASMKIPVLSAEIGLVLAEEGNEEIQANVKRLLQATTTAQISNAFINTVLTARKNHWFGANSITTAQTNGSIAQKIEKQIEKLPEFWRQPVEEFIEGFEEGIIEAGYVVATKADDWVAAMRYANQNNGVKRAIEVIPEKGSDEKLLLQGSQQEVKELAQTTLMGTFPIINNRDVGQILAEPVDEFIKPKKQLRKVVISFSEYPRPPYKRNGKVHTRSEISIPDARSGLKWNELRSAVPEYTRGDVYVSCELDSGRQMSGYFVSAAEGEKVLRKLATLSTSDIIESTFRSSKPDKGDGTLRTKRMHVHYAALLYPKKKNTADTSIAGKPVKVQLWNEKAPIDFKPFV